MIRLFVGIPLPQEVRQRLNSLQAGLERAHWISPENLHLTLRFIGDVEETFADDINDALNGVHAPGFDISLSGIETFGRGHMVHTIWAGVCSEPALLHVQGKVERALVQAGLEPEGRKYTPHVTIARVKKAPRGKVADWLAGHGGFNTLAFGVDRFVLFRSHLGNNGAHYEILAEYELELELEAQ